MEYKFELDRPPKPTLLEYNLDDIKIENLEKSKKKYESINNLISIFIFLLLGSLPSYFIIMNDQKGGYVFFCYLASAIFTWAVIPYFIKMGFQKKIEELIFIKFASSNTKLTEVNNEKYKYAMVEYIAKNKHLEKVVSRKSWEFWKSLNPSEFEESLALIYEEKGYKTTLTSINNDKGVDIIIEKDGKKILVQCKTYKNVIGPNVARELLGSMTAFKVNEGILASPSGFSNATKQFCQSHNITLLDLDGLTQITHDFENYTPYWIKNATSIQDLAKGIKKLSNGRRY